MRPSRTPTASRLTRRQWTALLGSAPLAAQTAASPAQPPSPEMGKASDGVRQASARLAQLEVPMNVEPAFSFKA